MGAFQVAESPEQAKKKRDADELYNEKENIDLSKQKEGLKEALFGGTFNPEKNKELSEKQITALNEDYIEKRKELQDIKKRKDALEELNITLNINDSTGFHELIIRTVSEESKIHLSQVRAVVEQPGIKKSDQTDHSNQLNSGEDTLKDTDGNNVTDGNGDPIKIGGDETDNFGYPNIDEDEHTNFTPNQEAKNNGLKESAQKDVVEAIVGSNDGNNDTKTIYEEITENEVNQEERSESPECEAIVCDTSKDTTSVLNLSEQIQNTPEYPIIGSLHKNGHIGDEELSSAQNDMMQAKKEEMPSLLNKYIGKIDDEVTKNKLIQQYKPNDNLGTNKNMTADKFIESDFHTDLQMVSKGTKIDTRDVGELEIQLANNYFSIPDKNGGESTKEDVSRTMDIVLNKIITKQSDSFKQRNADTINTIRSEKSISGKYQKLKQLYGKHKELDATKAGSRDQKQLLQKKLKIELDFKERKKELLATGQKDVGNDKTLIVLKKQHNDIISELKKITPPKQGDLKIGGGKNDSIAKNQKPEIKANT